MTYVTIRCLVISLSSRERQNASLVDVVALATQITACLEAVTHVNLAFQNKTINGADLPPVQVAMSHGSTDLQELYDLAVDLLAIRWKLGQGEVPPAVALVDHAANLVESLLDCEVVLLHEERYEVVVGIQLEVLAVRQDIVDSRGRCMRCQCTVAWGHRGCEWLQSGVLTRRPGRLRSSCIPASWGGHKRALAA